MRAIIIFILLVVAYQAVKVVFRSAMSAYQGGEPRPPRIPGEEMVQDPACKSYISKNHSYTVFLQGKKLFFCSEECYKRYAASHVLPKD